MPERDKTDFSQFLGEYLADVKESFQIMSNALFALEKDYLLTEPLDELFREVHTLKSSSSMIGFSGVMQLAQVVEGFLDRLRKSEVRVYEESIDILFEAIAVFEKMAGEYAESGAVSFETEGRAGALRRGIARLESREMPAFQGIIALNKERHIEWLNPAAERMFGYTSDAARGRHVSMLIPEPNRGEVEQFLAEYVEKDERESISREVPGVSKDGSVFPMELSLSGMNLPERRLFLMIVREAGEFKVKAELTTAIEKIQTIRVGTDLLDNLFNLVGELIINKNRIDTLIAPIEKKELKSAIAVLNRTINALQENVSASRMVPVDEIFRRFPRLVRDLAKNAGKEVEFIIKGGDIELDKAMLDSLGEPIIHLLRNAVDHGIREDQKPGAIRLTAKRAENHILIEVEDNGRGIDIGHMKEIAVKRGFIAPDASPLMQDRDVLNLLFKPGFTSAEKVTDVSGRGVGLDVVKTVAGKLSGSANVVTKKDEGSRFTMSLPLTTAIVQTLLVGVGEHIFAIPTDIISETLGIKREEIKVVQDAQVLILRDEAIPYFELSEVLGMNHRTTSSESRIAVIIARGERLIGVGVDSMIDQKENIIKPLDPIAQQFRSFSGGTILGDGSVALMLDIPVLLELKIG